VDADPRILLAGRLCRPASDRVMPNPIDHDRRPPMAGERPNGRRRLCGEAKRAEARAGV
jgi:hypothetical protein